MTHTEACRVHGDPLVPGTARPLGLGTGATISWDDAFILLSEAHFPNARDVVQTDHSEPVPVRYCPGCRAASSAWSRAPGNWSARWSLAELGYDPYRGDAAPTVEATLVDDYVWIEKYCRARYLISGALLFFVHRGHQTVEELILATVARARENAAPLDATHEAHGHWHTLTELDDTAVRMVMGAPLT